VEWRGLGESQEKTGGSYLYEGYPSIRHDEEKEVINLSTRWPKRFKVKQSHYLRFKNKACEKWYQRLETKDREKDVFRLVRVRERKTRDIRDVRYTEDKDSKVLVDQVTTKDRWQN